MKVGIVGDVTRGIAWENHLRPHNIVDEVPHELLLSSMKSMHVLF